ncbi:MAG: response regulator transcription factor [Candidatus Xenobiia bacterium LiM19]
MDRKKIVYVVEDEPEINDIIVRYLKNEHYEVTSFFRGDTALNAIMENPPDLIVLDIMLPGVDGMQMLVEIRKTMKMPVIFISAKKDEVDRVLGIELGGDDYLTKPFSLRELVARVKSAFRRIEFDVEGQEPFEKAVVRSNNLTLNLESRTLCSKNASTGLTVSEFSILKILMSRQGKTFTREELQFCLTEGDRVADTRATDIHIKNLRRKIYELGAPASLIQSIRGVGYKYED